MPLKKDFRETVLARAQQDPQYREAMLVEAVNCFLAGDIEVGKSMLRDYINATIGFEGLAKAVGKPSKSLHRMLAPAGNPSTKNLFAIVSCLQKKEGVYLQVNVENRAA